MRVRGANGDGTEEAAPEPGRTGPKEDGQGKETRSVKGVCAVLLEALHLLLGTCHLGTEASLVSVPYQ